MIHIWNIDIVRKKGYIIMNTIILVIGIGVIIYFLSKARHNETSTTSSNSKSDDNNLPDNFIDPTIKNMLESCFGPLNKFPNWDYSQAIIEYRKRIAGEIPENTDSIDIYNYFHILCNGLKAIKNSEFMRKVYPEPVQGKGTIMMIKHDDSDCFELSTVFYKEDGISCIWELAREGTLREPGFRMKDSDEAGFIYNRKDIPFSSNYFNTGFIVRQINELLPFASVSIGTNSNTFKSVNFSFIISSN